jgi:hypothetical protein
VALAAHLGQDAAPRWYGRGTGQLARRQIDAVQPRYGANVYAADQLFATLDTTLRKPKRGADPIVLSDTVGFIRDLPHISSPRSARR